jgi:hypothetical protein
MLRLVFVAMGMAAVLVLPARAEQDQRLVGAWVQTAPGWSVTAENPWSVMIFNAEGSFCGGAAKDKRYAEGEYAFDGELLTTISASSGRLSERSVSFGAGGKMVWDDPQIDEPVVMVRTDMFADCAAMKAHQRQ